MEEEGKKTLIFRVASIKLYLDTRLLTEYLSQCCYPEGLSMMMAMFYICTVQYVAFHYTEILKHTPEKLKEVTCCMGSLFIYQEKVEEHLPKTIVLEELVRGRSI